MSSDNKTQSYVVNSFLENNSYFHKNAKFAEGKRRHSAGLLAGTRRAPARFVFAYRFFRYAARSGVPAGTERRTRGMIVSLLRSSRVFLRPIPHAHAWGFSGCDAPPALARAPHKTRERIRLRPTHPPAPTKPIAPLPTHPLATLPHPHCPSPRPRASERTAAASAGTRVFWVFPQRQSLGEAAQPRKPRA